MKRASRKSLLTGREKVLLHLLSFQRYSQDPDAPRGVTQEGISRGISVGRNNVTKMVTGLADEGVVEIQSKHVKGLPSVRKVYFLTHEGFQEALELKNEVEATRIAVIDMDGNRLEDEVGRLGMYLPKRYSTLELALGVARGEFDCQSFHEGKIRDERRYVDFTDRKPTVRSFYGRAEELRRLEDFVGSDSARVLVVQGIAGIGKTTLLAKFAQDARERMNIFWFKLHEWVNLKGVLKPLAEFLSLLGRKALEWYLAQNESPNIGEACHVLEADLRGVSALWIFDDMQKADGTVTDLMSATASMLENVEGVKMICSSREVPHFYARSSVVAGTVEEMTLEGLDRESSMMLMRDRCLPDDALDEIYRVTGGHPLFMELVDDPGSALGKNVRMFMEQEVYSKLELSEKRILEIASVFRYPVPTDAFFLMEEEIAKEQGHLQRERGYQDYMVDYDTMDALMRKSLLKESSGRLVGMHDMLRDFFYSRLPPRKRVAFHRAASHYYLKDAGAPGYVEALYHSTLANECRSSVRIAAGNGREIIAKGYANLLAPLLDALLRKCGDIAPADRMEIFLLQAEVMDLQGEWDPAMQRYSDVLGLASPGRDRRLIGDVERRIGVILLRKGSHEEARFHLDRSKAIAETMDDAHHLSQVLYDLGGLAERKGDMREARACFQRSAQIARGIGEDVPLGMALYGEGRVQGQLQDLPRSVSKKREALRVLERTGELKEIAKVCVSLGADLNNLGMHEEAVRVIERGVALSDSVGDLATKGYALSNLAATYIESGILEKAEAAMEQAEAIGARLNERLIIAASHLQRGYLYSLRGEWEWAKESFRTSIEVLGSIGSPQRMSYWLYEIGKVYAHNSDLEEAAGLFREALAIASRSGQENLVRELEDALEGIGAPRMRPGPVADHGTRKKKTGES